MFRLIRTQTTLFDVWDQCITSSKTQDSKCCEWIHIGPVSEKFCSLCDSFCKPQTKDDSGLSKETFSARADFSQNTGTRANPHVTTFARTSRRRPLFVFAECWWEHRSADEPCANDCDVLRRQVTGRGPNEIFLFKKVIERQEASVWTEETRIQLLIQALAVRNTRRLLGKVSEVGKGGQTEVTP